MPTLLVTLGAPHPFPKGFSSNYYLVEHLKALKDLLFFFIEILTFAIFSQQDSQEFLIYLLEGLHEDVNRVTVKKKQIIKEEEGEEKIRYICTQLFKWNSP